MLKKYITTDTKNIILEKDKYDVFGWILEGLYHSQSSIKSIDDIQAIINKIDNTFTPEQIIGILTKPPPKTVVK